LEGNPFTFRPHLFYGFFVTEPPGSVGALILSFGFPASSIAAFIGFLELRPLIRYLFSPRAEVPLGSLFSNQPPLQGFRPRQRQGFACPPCWWHFWLVPRLRFNPFLFNALGFHSPESERMFQTCMVSFLWPPFPLTGRLFMYVTAFSTWKWGLWTAPWIRDLFSGGRCCLTSRPLPPLRSFTTTHCSTQVVGPFFDEGFAAWHSFF